MENLTASIKRIPGFSEFSEIDVEESENPDKPYTSFGDLLALTKDPDLKSIRDRKTNGNRNNGINSDLITVDHSGRPFVTPESLNQLAEEQKLEVAMLEHGNDPHTRMDLCGFPRGVKYRQRFLDYDFEREFPKAFKALNQGYWVFAYGPRGTRKTSLACYLGWQYLSKHPTRKAKFISVISWLEGMKPDSDREDVVPLPYLPPFVILDDFEKYQNTEWQKLRLFDLVDHLYRRADNFHVVITSNRSLQEINQQSGRCTRIVPALDRIKEMSLQVPLTGPSWRRSPVIE